MLAEYSRRNTGLIIQSDAPTQKKALSNSSLSSGKLKMVGWLELNWQHMHHRTVPMDSRSLKKIAAITQCHIEWRPTCVLCVSTIASRRPHQETTARLLWGVVPNRLLQRDHSNKGDLNHGF
eukprot:1089471-Amphidinium_carterae.1